MKYVELLREHNCLVLEQDLPAKVKGMTLKELDGCIIILNAIYPDEIRVKALEHEIKHLSDNDFSIDRYQHKEER